MMGGTVTSGSSSNILIPIAWSGLALDMASHMGAWHPQPEERRMRQRSRSYWSWIAVEIMARLSGYQGA